MNIDPLERLCINGIKSKFSQVFNCKNTEVTSAYEKMRILKERKAGENISYPMAFLKISTLSGATDRYTSPYLARTGVQIVSSDDNTSAISVKVLPANFQIDVEYRTNQFDLDIETSAMAFSRKWLFARRNGKLKFNISYGRVSFLIGSVMDEQVNIPERPGITESAAEYIVTSSLVLQAWISEPQTKIIGTVQKVDVTQALNFWAFPNGD